MNVKAQSLNFNPLFLFELWISIDIWVLTFEIIIFH
jgi:hypothetical protein